MSEYQPTNRDRARRGAESRPSRVEGTLWHWAFFITVGVCLGLRRLIVEVPNADAKQPIVAPRAKRRPQALRPIYMAAEPVEGKHAESVEEVAAEREEEPLPPEELHLDGGRIEHPRVSYEPSNIRLGAVLGIMAFVICFACFHYWAAWEFFGSLKMHEEQEKRSQLAPDLRPEPALPAKPRLEQLDRVAGIQTPNINRRMSVNEATLDSYGRVEEEGFVRVPIDRAIEQLVGRLPARKQQPHEQGHDNKARDQGLVDSGDSNSGRMFKGRQ
jgi:hypothetical protein